MNRNLHPCSISRMKKPKGYVVPKNVDEYLSRVPEPARSTLKKLRATIRSAAPREAIEAISYGIPTIKYKGALLGYGAFFHHCSFFPMNSSIIEEFKDELRGFQTSKGTIRFAVDKPLPATLVKMMVKVRVVQNERKKKQ